MIVVLPNSVYAHSLENGLWELTHKYECVVDGTEIDAPEGFLTDFASVPRFARSFIDPAHPHILRAAILHDFLYQNHIRFQFSRREADVVLRDGMAVCGATLMERMVVYYAVRLAGWHPWNRHETRPNLLAMRKIVCQLRRP